MPNLLRSLSIGKVDFVDRPADPHARTAIWKRDATPEDPDLEQEGIVPDQIPTLTDEVRKGLPEEARDVIDALTAALNEKQTSTDDAPADDAAADADADTDLAKRDDLPEDVKAAIAKRDSDLQALTKRLDDAETAREQEIAKRETREWRDRLAKFDGVLPEDAPEKFRAVAKQDEDLAEAIVKALDALREQVDTSALFGTAGSDAVAEGSAEAALEAKAGEIAKRDNIDEVEAFAKATTENPDLYDRHLAEKGA